MPKTSLYVRFVWLYAIITFCCLVACTPAEETPLAEIPLTPLMVELPAGVLRRLEKQPITRYDTTRVENGSVRIDTIRVDSLVRSEPIKIQGFAISRYEITQEQWEAVMGFNPSRFKGRYRPVENMTYEQAQEFCRRLSARIGVAANTYRLPSPTEWEYACRAGTETDFYSGALTVAPDDCSTIDAALDKVAWYCANAGGRTHTVGLKQPNDFTLYDMHGNVAEWVAGGSAELSMACGGSWRESPQLARASNRFMMQMWKRSAAQDHATSYIGLRIAR